MARIARVWSVPGCSDLGEKLCRTQRQQGGPQVAGCSENSPEGVSGVGLSQWLLGVRPTKAGMWPETQPPVQGMRTVMAQEAETAGRERLAPLGRAEMIDG